MQSNSMKMLLFTTCFLVLVGFIQSEQQVEVVIKNGPIIGQKIAEQGHSINQFLGIPYAQPPVGKLRFRRPVPAESWKEPLKALHWPNNCVQTLLFPEIANWHLSKNFTEDCLYLNIWSPDVTVNEDKLRPVLVWIHGGGLIIGSNSFMSYNGRTLSSMADALVVTINYRLSTLGFLYSDEVDDVKGNQAFWDQTLALEWVKENIRYFGGDPSQITIFGESAGSWSVSALILSPVSRNLFKNAIMMSGSVTYGVVDDAETIVTKQLKGIRAVGCATDSDTTISRKVVECLEQLEPEKVDSIYYKSAPMFHSIAVVDSQFFPENPSQMLANGNHKKNFNLLVDTVEDEGTGIFILTNRDSKIREVNTESLTLKEAHDILSKEVSNTFPKHKASKDAFNKVYFNGINGHLDNPDLMRKQVGVAFGDFFLTCPTINFAKSVFGNNPDTVNVYQWFYTAKLGKPSFTCPEWTGACHGDDLQPVFGIPFQSPPIFHNRMRDISREVITFIKSFIRTGTPGDEQSEWQSYFMGADGQTVVAPYYEVGIQPKSHSSLKLDLKRTECDLWNQYYY